MSYYLDENENIVDKASADWAIANGKLDLANLTTITSAKAEEIKAAKKKAVTSQPEFLATEAQAYLNSTDYIYLSQKEKGLSDEEVAEKYADIITKRIEQRAIVSAYEDSL